MVAAGQLDLYWEIGCWSWDVCAGTIIAREAGGKVYGAPRSSARMPSSSLTRRDSQEGTDRPAHTAKGGKAWTPQDLMGHHFFVVRAIPDSEGETGEEAQDRIAREFFQVAEEWDV